VVKHLKKDKRSFVLDYALKNFIIKKSKLNVIIVKKCLQECIVDLTS